MDPVTMMSAGVIASTAFVLASATRTAMSEQVDVVRPMYSDVGNSQMVAGDYWGRTRRSLSNQLWSDLPVPSSQDANFWNSQQADQPIVARGVRQAALPQPLTHAPSVTALTNQTPTVVPPQWY
jgi:hypothetical protein